MFFGILRRLFFTIKDRRRTGGMCSGMASTPAGLVTVQSY